MFRFLKSSRKPTARPAKRARRSTLAVEALESRQLMSGTPLSGLGTLPYFPPQPITILDPIQVKYQSLGGAQGFLGDAVTAELPTADGRGSYQLYQHGAIYYSAATGAHDLLTPTNDEYLRTASEHDASGRPLQPLLGLPTTDDSVIRSVPVKTVGDRVLGTPILPILPTRRVTQFEGGTIYWSQATGAHVVYGDILTEYGATANEHGASGRSAQAVLGMPTSDETDVPGVAGARMNTFQGGTVYWSPSTGAHVIYGPIAAKYDSAGGPTSFLGLPTTDVSGNSSVQGMFVTYFQGSNAIYWSPATGAHLVYGDIGAEYDVTGEELDASARAVRQVLGAPTSDEMNVPGKAPGLAGARMNTFEHGAIYWSPSTGAHVVYGAVAAKYKSAGGPTRYGLPTSDEDWVTDVNGMVVRGVRGQSFQGNNRAIYWSKAYGAHLVYGDINGEYVATGRMDDTSGRPTVRLLLGAPTSDEMNVPGVPGARMNTFQGGTIYWSPSTGANTVYGDIAAKCKGPVKGPAKAPFYGLPTHDVVPTHATGVYRQTFQGGTIYWSAATGAHFVNGPIEAEHLYTDGNERDANGKNLFEVLGAPTSDVTFVPGLGTTLGSPRMITFQNGGVIYWSRSTGAHVVYGAILAKYNSVGGPANFLGLPVADEQDLYDGNGGVIGRISKFQHGKITWTPQDGAVVTG